jgi:hypothetical protein
LSDIEPGRNRRGNLVLWTRLARDRPLGVLAVWRADAPLRRLGRTAKPGPAPGENALMMRGSRPLAAGSVAYRPVRGAIAGSPGVHANQPRRPERPHEVINVLCHDLPRPVSRAIISSVEREATHSRCCGWARTVASRRTGYVAAVDAFAVFIDRRHTPARAQRRSGCRPWRSPAICAAEPFTARRVARPCAHATDPNGCKLHLPLKCNSMLANVYSGPGATRGEGSGGVGKRHAGHGSEH